MLIGCGYVENWSFFCFFKQKTAYEMRISDWSSDVCSSDLFATAWRVSDHSKPIGIDGRTVTLSERKTELDVGLVGYKGEKNGEEVQLARPREWSYKDLKGALVVVTGGGSMNRETYDAIQELAVQRGLQIGRASCRERVCKEG